jgi:hypothetical protein
MDPELDTLIRTFDRFYKKMDNFKYCKDFHMLMVPDINTAIDGYYQNKLNKEIEKANTNNKEDIEKIKNEMNDKANEEIDIQDDYIRSVKHNFIKIKDKQFKRIKQEEQKNKSKLC